MVFVKALERRGWGSGVTKALPFAGLNYSENSFWVLFCFRVATGRNGRPHVQIARNACCLGSCYRCSPDDHPPGSLVSQHYWVMSPLEHVVLL